MYIHCIYIYIRYCYPVFIGFISGKMRDTASAGKAAYRGKYSARADGIYYRFPLWKVGMFDSLANCGQKKNPTFAAVGFFPSSWLGGVASLHCSVSPRQIYKVLKKKSGGSVSGSHRLL